MGSVGPVAAGGCDAAAGGLGGGEGAGKAAGAALAADGAWGPGGADTWVVAAGREAVVLHLCNLSTANATRKLKRAASTKMPAREIQASRGTSEKSSLLPDMRLRERKRPPVVQRPNRRARAGNLLLPLWLGRAGSSSVVSSVMTSDTPPIASCGRVSGTRTTASSRGVSGAPAAGR